MTDFWLLVFRALPELGGQLNEWPQIFRKRPFCWFRLNFCSWPIVRIPTPCPIAAVAFSGWLVWRLNPDRLFPAICRPWPLILSGHPEDWFALKPAGQPTEVPRPIQTFVRQGSTVRNAQTFRPWYSPETKTKRVQKPLRNSQILTMASVSSSQ